MALFDGHFTRRMWTGEFYLICCDAYPGAPRTADPQIPATVSKPSSPDSKKVLQFLRKHLSDLNSKNRPIIKTQPNPAVGKGENQGAASAGSTYGKLGALVNFFKKLFSYKRHKNPSTNERLPFPKRMRQRIQNYWTFLLSLGNTWKSK